MTIGLWNEMFANEPDDFKFEQVQLEVILPGILRTIIYCAKQNIPGELEKLFPNCVKSTALSGEYASFNVAWGLGALKNICTGKGCIAIGNYALDWVVDEKYWIGIKLPNLFCEFNYGEMIGEPQPPKPTSLGNTHLNMC